MVWSRGPCGGPGRVLGSRKLRYHRVRGQGQGNHFPEGTGNSDYIFPLESLPPVNGNPNPCMPQSPGIGATVKTKVGLAPAECSLCLDLSSLAGTQRLGNALPPVLDRVSYTKQPCQRQSLPAFLPILPIPSPPALAHTLAGATLAQSRWSSRARKRRFSPQMVFSFFL